MALIGVLAGVALAAALSLLVAFFVAKSQLADRLSNWAFLAFEILSVPVILEIHRRYVDQAAFTWVFTLAGLAAMAVLVVTGVLIVAGRVEFARVSYAQTGAFAMWLVWVAGTGYLVLAHGGLPVGLGWLALGAVVVGLGVIGWMSRDRALVRGEKTPTRTQMFLSTVPFIGLVGWLIWLGASL